MMLSTSFQHSLNSALYSPHFNQISFFVSRKALTISTSSTAVILRFVSEPFEK